MVNYIETFSERFHHPKEDAYLFERLAARSEEAAQLLERLKNEHTTGADKLCQLRQALIRYHKSGADGFVDFAAQVASYAAFHWDHMRLEENQVLPLAHAYLTPEDWAAIDAAFLGHTDPLLGVERAGEFQELFRRIVELAPAPIGLALPR